MGGPSIDRLAERLGLDAYQTEQVEGILGGAREKGLTVMMEIRDEAKAKMDVIHAETVEELSTVLTAEQLAEFEEISQRFRSRGFGPRGFGPRHGLRHSRYGDDT